jgi:hypothetical protein
MATNGPVLQQVDLDGLEPGEKLTLVPASETASLAMMACSILDA